MAALKTLARLLPQGLFARLLLLLVACVILSHVLALSLLFELYPPPCPSDTHPQCGRPPPPMLNGGHLLDIGIRLAALALAAWIGARWLAQPMRRLADAALALGRDLNHPQLAETGPREYRDTTRVFNRMQGLLREQLDQRDQFVAAVSHDLRTPLTRLRLRIEQLPDRQSRIRLVEDVREMDEMITATLDYLRGAADEESLVLLDVQALVQSVADDEAEAEAGVDVWASGQARPVRAQALALRRAVRNLVQNAVRYGGRARIVLVDSDSTLEIRVHDDGPGIPEADIERVLQPFQRVDASRNRRSGGIGLGLSIVARIAHRHGGTLALTNREGGGFTATLSLPR